MRRYARLFSLVFAAWFVFVTAGIQGLHTHGVSAAAEKTVVLTTASPGHNPSDCAACRYLTVAKAGAPLPPAVSAAAPAIHLFVGSASSFVAADRLDAQLTRAPPIVSL